MAKNGNGNTTRLTGRVARIVLDRATGARRGFGFIAEDASNDQYYFHATDLVRGGASFALVNEGQRVSFQPTATEKGPRAAHVEIGD